MNDPAAEPTKPDRQKMVRADRTQPELWIISDYRFFEHANLESAVTERARLATCFPEKNFRIYRCKRKLSPSTTKETLLALRAECETLRKMLADLYRFIASNVEYDSGAYDEPPGPANQFSHDAGSVCAAIQRVLGKNHEELAPPVQGFYDGVDLRLEDPPDFSEVEEVPTPKPPPFSAPFPQFADIKVGDRLIADDGFDCIDEDEIVEVAADESGQLYVPCRDVKHYLDTQQGENGECVGLRRAP